MLCDALLAVLLARWCGQEDVAIGTVTANRERAELAPLLGFFVNTLVLRHRVPSDSGFADWLAQVRDLALAAFAHGDMPFEKLVEDLNPDRSTAHAPLFQVSLNWRTAESEAMRLIGLQARPLAAVAATAKFDLDLGLVDLGDRIEGAFVYNTDLFEGATMTRLAHSFATLAAAAAAAPDLPLERLDLLGDYRAWTLDLWRPAYERPAPATLPSLLARAVAARPEHPALVCLREGQSSTYSYAELDRLSDRLAARLAVLGVVAQTPLGICLADPFRQALALIAAAKSGALLVPIDPVHPLERQAFMLEDAGVRHLLTEAGLPCERPTFDGQWLELEAELALAPVALAPVRILPEQALYLIYSSGSSGRPKGVVVAHQSFVRMTQTYSAKLRLDGETVALLTMSYAFDFGFIERWSSWATAATLVALPSHELLDPATFRFAIDRHQVNTLQCTPALIRELVAAGAPLRGLRLLHVGGENLTTQLIRDLRRAAGPDCLFVNGYGPTEVTVSAAMYELQAQDEASTWEAVVIGPQIGNHCLFVCDRFGNPVPAGALGELRIGRDLAFGYHRRPAQTALQFVPDDLSGDFGARLYRSGELVRARLDHGQRPPLEFCGRIERQVKFRGYRIEPAGIEAVLVDLVGVRAAAVFLRASQGQTQLCACVLPAPGASLMGQELRRQLLGRLPEHMVPSAIAVLDSFPMTANGKLDLEVLGRLFATDLAKVPTATRQPATAEELLLAEIWGELLGLAHVSADAHFFQLGGHSLLCTRVLVRLVNHGYQLPLRLLFEFPVLADLAKAMAASAEKTIPVLERAADRPFPLSFPQLRLWFLDRFNAGTAAATSYNLPVALALHGPLQVQALEAALSLLVARHESLRTRFVAGAEEPQQLIAPPAPLRLAVVDVGTREALARSLAAREAAHRFDLSRGPLFRCRLLRLAPDHHLLLLNQHHIISDAWSLERLSDELCAAYAAALAGREPALVPLRIGYADYAAWQRSGFAEPRMQRQLDWWCATLSDLPGALDLPSDRPRPTVASTEGALVPLVLEPALRASLATLAAEQGASLFMLCDALFACLLGRWCRQDDLAVGILVTNRERAELAPLIGFFVNTLVLRHRLPRGGSFRAFLVQVREMALAAFAHAEVPFEQVVEALNPERELGHAPLFQVSLNWHARGGEPPRLAGLQARPLAGDAVSSKFDLTLDLADDGQRLQGSLVYRRDLFDRATMARLARAFETLAASAAADPERPLAALDLFDADARRWLLALWNPAPESYADQVVSLFRRAAACAGDKPALVAVAGETVQIMSYAELDADSERLAACLVSAGLVAQDPVGLCLSDPRLALLGLLAAAKAGALLVPIDPLVPWERQSALLRQSGARFFLTEAGLHQSRHGFEGHWFDAAAALAAPQASCKLAPILPEQPIYAIFTSGSTGQPKGVVLAHQAFARMTEAYNHKLRYDAATIALLTMSYAFDFGFMERFCTLVAGGTLVALPTRELVDPAAVQQVLRNQRVNALQCTPSYLRALLAAGVSLAGLRCIHVGGETVQADLIRAIRRSAASDCLLINGYGPTETAVSSTMHEILERDAISGWDSVPIGRMLGNHCLFVCDGEGQPVLAGACGELRVGRDLAFGYLGRPAATAAVFVPDHLSGQAGARLYRTGDLVRARFDGDDPPVLAFLGRIDRQIKLRGYRIELGEVETALTALAEVRAAVALLWPPQQPRLVACLRLAEGAELAPESLRARLALRLPEYMIPADFVAVAAFPLTVNGKLDQAALGQLVAKLIETAPKPSFRAPTTPEERLLAEIWGELLGRDQIGAEANFFHLGGHSLLCTRVLGRLDRAGYAVPLRLLFEYPVLAQLARALAAHPSADAIAAAPRLPGATFPLSHAQSRLWFLDSLATTPDAASAYNLPIALFFDGPLDPLALETAVGHLIERHESLRTRIVKQGDSAAQQVDPPAPYRLPVLELGLRAEAAQRLAEREAGHRFDLASGPLFRLALVRLHGRRHLLLGNQHHIITDGTSIGLLTRELALCYNALVSDRGLPELQPLPLGYVDYALWTRSAQAETRLAAGLERWQQRLAGLPSLLELPLDRVRPSVQTFRGAAVPLAFGPALRARLAELAARRDASLFMVCDAVFAMLLARLSGQTDIAVGTLSANRERAELASILGFFVNTLVLRHQVSPRSPFLAYLDQVRETALAAFADGDVPFEQLVLLLRPERSLGHTPIFQVAFNWQAADAEPPHLRGLIARPLAGGQPTAKFDLSLSLGDDGHDLRGALVYNTDLFEHATIARLARFLVTLASATVAAPHSPIGALDFLDQADRSWLLSFWNPPEESPCRATLPGYFLRAAARHPERPALLAVTGGLATSYSYARLAADSARLAAQLAGSGVRTGRSVGVCLRDPYLVLVGLIGAVRAGATLVLLDPAYPLERQAFILADADAALCLSERELRPGRAPFAGAWLELDELATRADAPSWREPSLLPEQPLYLIYTSGSTGQPKGVVLPHQAFCRMMDDYAEKLGLNSASVALQTMSYAFDFGFIERWSTLAAGARLVALAAQELTDPTCLAAAMRDYQVDALQGTPSFVREMIVAGVSFAGLKLLHLGGEALERDFVRQVRSQTGPDLIFINGYGPTEAAVSSSMHFIGEPDERSVWSIVPIGREVANHALFVCDRAGRLVPPGALGELLVGRLLAFGYHQRPALTASLFVPDHLSGASGGRLYRTGDLVRARFDHGEPPVLAFHGRIDRQLKLRGYRLEPGEVEDVLGSLEGVHQNAVFPWSYDGNRLLTACVMARPGLELDPEQLKRQLQERLPDYMVPAVMVLVDRFPLTPNGKLDTAALGRLAEASFSAEPAQDAYIAPRTPAEWLLAEVWAEVLGLERVSVRADFFQLGGHSLLGTRVVARLHQRGFDLPLNGSNSTDFRLDRGAATPLVPASPDAEGTYPSSFAQQRLAFIDQLIASPHSSGAYNMPLNLALEGPLDLAALESALSLLCERHPSLRTSFVEVEGALRQRLAPWQPLRLPLVEVGPRREQAHELAARHSARVFDLARPPLFRVLLLRLRTDYHLLSFVQHHIVSDAWSVGILTRELCQCYDALARGGVVPPLAALPVTYADYAHWQQLELQGQRLARYVTYWRAQLAGLPSKLDLPSDRPRPTLPRFRGEAVAVALAPTVVAELRRLAEQTGATLFMLVHTVFAVLLARHSGQRDLAIGVPYANRDRPELDGLLGFFVNTLVLRHRIDPQATFLGQLEQVRRTALAAYAHGAFPFEKLVELLQPERRLGVTPLFQVMFNWQAESEPSLRLPGLSVQPLGVGAIQAKFDLVLNLAERGERVVGALIYDSDLFAQTSIARFAAQFTALAAAMAAAPDLPLARHELLTPDDRRWLMELGNPQADAPCANLARDWFGQQVNRTPDAIALVACGAGRAQATRYAELDAEADALAAKLADLGVASGTPVGVHLHHPRAVLVGLLAAARRGALLVLLDPALPEARQRFILEDSGTRLVLTQTGLARPEGNSCHWLDLDAPCPPARPSAVRILPEQPVYLIYTSGSTGQPKGVLLPQAAFAAAVRSHLSAYPYRADARVLLTLTYAFDFGMIVRWCSLASGATLVAPAAAELTDPEPLARICREQGVDTLHCTPSFARALVSTGFNFRGLRLVHLGGEALTVELVAALRAQLDPGCRILNGYGPTEAGVSATLHEVGADAAEASHETVPIGRFIADHGLFVCDPQGCLTPPGVAGELWIGRQLAAAYLGRPGLTAERFVPDPFSGDPGARLYRSGDLVRWRVSGPGAPCLVYLGRIDRQLKLRGYRIEPGEIEALLARHPAVRAVAVCARPDLSGEPLLAAYLCLDPGVAEPLDFAAYLDGQLPSYMIPAVFIPLEQLPRNANGKLDEAALPRPQRAPRGYQAPRGALESAMAELWAELLGLARVGARDHFFELGGHSLQATRLIHLIQRRFGVALPLQTLFLHPTVAALSTAVAAYIDAVPSNSAAVDEPLVTLRAAGEGLSLFLVHPVGGDIFCYRALADRLGADMGCHAFRAAGLEGAQLPLTSVEAMAEHYLPALLRLCPSGPVVLGGWSFGGAVAYEMATRLRSAGRDPVQVVLIDTYPPRQSAQAKDPGEMLRAFARDLELPLQLPQHQPRLEDLAEALRGLPEGMGLDLAALHRLFRVYCANSAALDQWRPRPARVALVLLHTAAYPERGLTHWRQLAELRHQRVEGDHYSMLKTPHVAGLVRQIRAHLPFIQCEDPP